MYTGSASRTWYMSKGYVDTVLVYFRGTKAIGRIREGILEKNCISMVEYNWACIY